MCVCVGGGGRGGGGGEGQICLRKIRSYEEFYCIRLLLNGP